MAELESVIGAFSVWEHQCICGSIFTNPEAYNIHYTDYVNEKGIDNVKVSIPVLNSTTIEDATEIQMNCPDCGVEAIRFNVS